MDTLSLLLSFIFGIIIGSFLNVVILRYNTGFTIGGRSRCLSCSKTLTWKELIPLASFVAQKGACRNCKSRISWQYPLVEGAAGLLFALIFIEFPPVSVGAAVLTALYLIITALLLVVTAYDIKHKIVPDFFVYTFAIAAFVKLFVNVSAAGLPVLHMPLVIDLLAGPLLALPFVLLWLFSKGEWIGLGDAKVVLGIGWALGFVGAVSALILAFWIGAAVSVIWMLIVFRKIKTHYEIPFAPYLILGMYIVLIWGVRVIDLRPILGLFHVNS